jgi:arsenite methyltransferase
VLDRFLAVQFARPQGAAGRLLLGPLLDWVGAPMMNAAFHALEPRAGEAILDLGIGGGALSARLLRAGVQLTGVDPSDAMLARAAGRHRAAVRDGQAQFLAGSAAALPLADAAVQKAASVNTVYFWADLGRGMAELSRVLRPGGRLVLGFQTAEAVRAWPGHVHGFRAWEDAELVAAVEGAGFAIDGIRAGHDRRVRDYRTLIALRG